jgi:hypothetical protein
MNNTQLAKWFEDELDICGRYSKITEPATKLRHITVRETDRTYDHRVIVLFDRDTCIEHLRVPKCQFDGDLTAFFQSHLAELIDAADSALDDKINQLAAEVAKLQRSNNTIIDMLNRKFAQLDDGPN